MKLFKGLLKTPGFLIGMGLFLATLRAVPGVPARPLAVSADVKPQ